MCVCACACVRACVLVCASMQLLNLTVWTVNTQRSQTQEDRKRRVEGFSAVDKLKRGHCGNVCMSLRQNDLTGK